MFHAVRASIGVISTLVLSSAFCATILVPEEQSLNNAVLVANDGDTLSVAAGTHAVSPELRITQNDLILVGRTGNPSDVCISPATDGIGILSSRGTSGVRIENLCFREVLSPVTGALTVRECDGWFIRNCSFTFNRALQQGAVGFLGSSAVVSNCTFSENIAAFSGGGGILFLDSGLGGHSLTIEGCLFRGNLAAIGGSVAILATEAFKEAKGGALGDPSRFLIENTVISDSIASIGTTGYGGGVYISSTELHPASGVITGSTITGCAAALTGGGIAALRGVGDVTLRVEDCLFSNNIVGASHGGAIAVDDSPGALPPIGNPYQARITISSCRIMDNTAEISGGGVSILPGEHSTTATIQNSDFERNSARNGGAICLASIHTDFDLYRVLNNNFNDNDNRFFNDGTGAALCLIGTQSEVRGNNISANRNSGLGGGAALVGDGSWVSENRFGDGIDIGNDASRGAGVYIRFEPVFADLRPRVVNNLFIDNLGFSRGAGLHVESGVAAPQAFIGGNVFIENFGFEGAKSESVAFEGSMGEDVIFAHNTIIDHASGGELPNEQKGVPLEIPSVVYLANGAEPLIANNLIYNTSPTEIAGVFEDGDLAPRMVNNAFFNVNPIYVNTRDTALSLGELNDLASAEGNLEVDPQLVPGFLLPFRDYRDPHLAHGSPLTDAAANIVQFDEELLADLPRDIDALLDPPGDPRIAGFGPDIGADEIGPTPTPVDCDVVDGDINPRCDGFDLLVLIQNQSGIATGIDTDFDEADGDDYKDLFLFATGWYSAP